MKLRDYQQTAINAVFQAQSEGINRQILVLATGTGKTVIFSHLIAELIKKTGKKALVLAHRDELLRQAKEKLLLASPNLNIEIEQAEKRAVHKNTHVIIASVQTLGRGGSTRIQKFNPRDFCVVIIDEAHHASAGVYKNILSYFGLLKKQAGDEQDNDWNRDCLLVGVTATPNRSDNEGIDAIFDAVSFEYHIIRAIKEGHLSRIRAFKVETGVDLTGVHKIAGDFKQDELSKTVDTPQRNAIIAKTYLDRLKGKQALVFCVDVKHTLNMTNQFLQAGIEARHILGATDKNERERIVKAFDRCEFPVLTNCLTLTEGVDIPSIQAVLLARPTQSNILFQQMIGRGTRLHPEKEHLTIVDFVDSTDTHKLQTTSSLLGLGAAIDFKERDILETKKDIDELIEHSPLFPLDEMDVSKMEYYLREVNIQGGELTPVELEGMTSYAWFRFREGYYRLSLSDGRIIHCYKTILNKYEILDEVFNFETKEKEIARVAVLNTLFEAVKYADRYIMTNYPDIVNFISLRAAWRDGEVSPGQTNYLMKFGLSPERISKLNKGQASQLLSKLFSLKPSEREQFLREKRESPPF